MNDQPIDNPFGETDGAAFEDATSSVEPDETRLADADADEAEEPDELTRVIAERDEYLGSLQRVAAEFENYRKRMERERVTNFSQAGRDVIEQLLPVMDSLERAVEALADVDEARSGGVAMVEQQLAGVLAGRGLSRIEPHEGEPFDPEVHEAIQSLPTPDHIAGTLVAIVQTGYRFSDGALLRPARVVVAAAPESSNEEA